MKPIKTHREKDEEKNYKRLNQQLYSMLDKTSGPLGFPTKKGEVYIHVLICRPKNKRNKAFT